MKTFILVGLVFLVLVIGGNSLFVVKQTERAVMLQFGEIVQADIQPGIHVKIPWVNTVRIFDGRSSAFLRWSRNSWKSTHLPSGASRM